MFSKGSIYLFPITLGVLFSSCNVSSNFALKGEGGRNAYNITLQTTSNEQLLLNLVRLRYCDTPYFLNVNNITTQFSYGAEASTKFLFPGFNEKNPAAVGGTLNWRSQPTVIYSPLEGKAFAELLLQPLDLTIIQQMIYSGWDIDRVFRLGVQSFCGMHNAPTASGPFPNDSPEYKDFYEVTKLMRHFQKRNELQIGVKTSSNAVDPRGTSLQIFFPSGTVEGEHLSRLLGGLDTSKGYYILDMNLGFQSDGEIGVMPRSVLSCMYYLSLGVEIPSEHERKKIAIMTQIDSDGKDDLAPIIKKLITIKTSSYYPKNAYLAVKYKKFWYYIDDCDINSKRTFSLLLSLYNLQAGGVKQMMPILTIPIS
jgi:hypothetical protein